MFGSFSELFCLYGSNSVTILSERLNPHPENISYAVCNPKKSYDLRSGNFENFNSSFSLKMNIALFLILFINFIL
ncbi:hypothetical protein AYI68_g2130 [Smittium mucronatum]|uniref:Uncharacterized protein n=1 Tax=Smittium mucronatum TaxID=133383 RepID=A0A1R0H3N0_9FUNG|nr:hypothetical protein AYI68_g2130 [Smittium mucronatum]